MKRPVYIAVITIAAVVVISGVALLVVKFGRGSAGLANASIQLVKDGKALATIVVDRSQKEKPDVDDAAAAKVLVDWIKKITDVSLPISDAAPQNGTQPSHNFLKKSAGLSGFALPQGGDEK